MKKLNINQTGSAVIILLVVLVLAIVGFGGYYVWHSNNKQSTTAKSTASISNSQETFMACAKVDGATLQTPDQLLCTDKNGKKYVGATLAPIKTSNRAVYQVNWPALPPALQQAVTQAWPKPADCAGQYVAPDQQLASGSTISIAADSTAAIVGIGCGGVAGHLFVLTYGTWNDLAHTQVGSFSCELIAKYQIPATFSQTCYDSNNIQHVVVANK